MKSTGMFRRIDCLGRFVLPKELRKSMDIDEDDYLQIFIDGDDIILRKSQINCIICGGNENLVDHHDKKICQKCIEEIASR